MNKIIPQTTTNYTSYFGILFLYMKLFFVKPIFAVEDIDISASLFILLVILFRVIINLIFYNINVFGNNKAARNFWLFIFFSTLSSLYLSPEIAKGVFTVNFQLFLVYLLFIDFKILRINQFGIKKVINGLVYFAIVNTLLLYYTFFFGKIGLLGEVSITSDYTRAFGIMGDQLPWFLSFFAINALYSKKKLLFLFFAIGILMGASIGASIILFISIFFYFIKEMERKPVFYLRTGLVIIFIIGFVSFSPNIYNKIGIFQRFSNSEFTLKENNSTVHRLNAFSTAIENIPNKPLFGFQNYALVMFNKYDKLLSDYEKGDLTFLTTPNNQFLAIICDYGIIGLILFVYFIYSLLKIVRLECSKVPPNLNYFKKASYMWLVIFVLFNQSATWFLPGSFLWILICLIIAINYKINQLYAFK